MDWNKLWILVWLPVGLLFLVHLKYAFIGFRERPKNDVYTQAWGWTDDWNPQTRNYLHPELVEKKDPDKG